MAVIIWLGIPLYAFLLVVSIVVYGHYRYRKGSLTKIFKLSVPNLFYSFTCLFAIMRVVWISMRAPDDNAHHERSLFILNRVVLMVFLSIFLIVLFFWMSRYCKLRGKGELPVFLRPSVLKWAFIVFNKVLWAIQIIVAILSLVQWDDGDHPVSYEVGVWLILLLSLAVAVAFLVYGVLLLALTSEKSSKRHHIHRAEMIKIPIITTVFTLCFLSRAACYAYRPLTGNHMQQVLFFVFAYYIPELLPIFVQLYLVVISTKRTRRHAYKSTAAEAEPLQPSSDAADLPETASSAGMVVASSPYTVATPYHVASPMQQPHAPSSAERVRLRDEWSDDDSVSRDFAHE